MSQLKRRSVSRRGVLAAMAAMCAAMGAFSLSARGASAAPSPPTTPEGPPGSTARTTSRGADSSARAAHTNGEYAMLDQMTSARGQDAIIRPS
jgi:hypothetical protein